MSLGPITKRLGLGFGITLVLILSVGLLGIVNVVYLSSLANEMYQHPFTVSNSVLEANGKIIAMHRSMKDVALARDLDSIETASELVDSLEREVHELFELIQERFLGDPVQIEDAHRVFSEWKAIRDEVIELTKAGRRDEAVDITRGKGARHVEKIQTKMNELIEFARFKASNFLSRANSARDSVTLLMALFLTAALVLGAGVAVYAVRENIKGFGKLNSEIAERKRVEAALERSRDRLVMANKELESFSYSVSHDLKAPLRHISEYAKILESTCPEHIDRDGLKFLEEIKTSVRRMNDLIESLLELSKISRQKIKRAAVIMSEMALGILNGLRREDPNRLVATGVEGDVSANADEALMYVVLQNLLNNAWKFTRNTENAEIHFGVTDVGGKKAFFVRDNGAGFDQSKADFLFQPFQRLHSQKEFGGTGIGLATVQRIIQRHGGKIWAEGRPDKGATFYFTVGNRS